MIKVSLAALKPLSFSEQPHINPLTPLPGH
jgi:hypothetical protein